MLEQRYLPAIRAGRLDEARRIHDNTLAKAYIDQHQAVLRLVAMSNAYRAAEQGKDELKVGGALALAVLMAVMIMAGLWIARRRIERDIVEPLVISAQAMHAMAQGNYDEAIPGLGRNDEIGLMAQAMKVFQATGRASRQAEKHQRDVVEALNTGLSKLASKDLEHRIYDAFSPEYDVLRLDYNRALDALMEAIASVRVAAAALMRSTSEIRVASQDLANRNEVQAASLEETAASLREVARAVEQSAANTIRCATRQSRPIRKRAWGRGGQPRHCHHGRHRPVIGGDRPDHQCDRWHRFPDESACAQCRGRGGPGGRGRKGLCGGGQRSAGPGAA
jgi:methyl-accepting chemotaxis protein